MVLLHGMATSSSYWNKVVDQLPDHEVLRMDLLGFGKSPKPKDSTYDYAAHVGAVAETIKSLNFPRPFTLVGHSMGALIALRYATLYPSQIKNVLLVSTPVYMSPSEAKRGVTQDSKLKEKLYYGLASRLVCEVVCKIPKPLAKRLVRFHINDDDTRITEDIVDHTYRSYSKSLENIIEHQTTAQDLWKVSAPVEFLYGKQDEQIALKNAKYIADKQAVPFVEVEGSHALPLEDPEVVAGRIIALAQAKGSKI